MFRINMNGRNRDQFVKKESIKMLIWGPLLSFVYLFLTYVSMHKWLLGFYIAGSFLTLFAIFLFVYAPLKMLRRHNHTIKSMAFNEGYLSINSFKALWLKPKEYKIPDKDFRAKATKFPWYGKGVPEVKEGITIQVNGKKDFYFVYDYFDDYEKIKDELLSRSK